MSKIKDITKITKITTKDKFTLYVFLVIIASSVFSVAVMWLLEKWNQYREFNYVIFLSLSFLISSSIASRIIMLFNKRSKRREELFMTLMEKVAKSEFDFEFPLTGRESLDNDIRNFNSILKQLNSVTILKEDFISNFSHEFKTPITSIKGFAEILQTKKNLTDQERQEYLQIIIDESTRLTNLSKNILLIGKLDSQFLHENKEIFSLDEQIAEIIFMLDHEISKKNIETDISLEKLKVNASKELIGHIWINLLTNAIKFTNDEIIIKSSLSENNEYIVVKISDNGIGIKKEDLPRIFDRYYQSDKPQKISGNGLGLSIVKKVIEIVHGKIEVESEENQGTTFTVYLPNELNNKK